MEFLSEIIKEYCQIPCFWPANFEKCIIDATKEKKDIVEIKQNFSLDLGK